MKIAVSATEPSLEAQVDPRFGRCRYLVIVDPDTMQFETMENSGATAGSGAGISTAQSIAQQGVEAVLTGNCGPNAFPVLTAAAIKVITGVSGTVQEAARAYAAGGMSPDAQPSVPGHFGSGGGRGRGRGRS